MSNYNYTVREYCDNSIEVIPNNSIEDTKKDMADLYSSINQMDAVSAINAKIALAMYEANIRSSLEGK